MDAALENALAQRRIPALWFHTVEPAHSKSRMGGLPSLPDGMDWPVNPDTGLALHFMAQIDLSALPATPLPGCPVNAALPRRGMLYFFFDWAEYWETEFGEFPAQSRVIHGEAAGADRPAPDNLPMIGYTPGTMGGGNARSVNVLPPQHLRAYVIDTFWGAADIYENGRCVLPLSGAAEDAKFQSIVNATGEAPPVFPSYNDIPDPPPSYYTYANKTGLSKDMQGLQMLGAESWDAGSRPDEKIGALLAEFRLGASDPGSLQFRIGLKDLQAQRFDRVFGTPYV